MENKDQNISFENEFLKLKLKVESGAHIYECNLPPNLENDFLKYIMAFEEAAREKKVIKLFDKIYRPEFSLEIEESLLASELERLLNHLEKHHIKVTTLCEVSDKELYRFIIQDLFEEIINDVPHIEKGFSYFTYEDFYPNHPYDISNRLEDLRQVLIKKEIGLYSWVFSEEFVSIEGNKLSEKEVTRQLENFFNGYHFISVFDCKELKY